MTRFLVAGRFVALAVLLTAISASGSIAATRLSGGGQGRPMPPGGCLEVDSNMGFLLQTSLDDVPALGDDPTRYFVSVPMFFGLEDVADAALADPCDVASGSGDGVVDARDLLCDWWTSRAGSMTVSRRDDELQVWQSLTARRDAGGQVEFLGDWTQPLSPREAYVVTVDGGTVNPIAIVGSHDPMSGCREFALEPGGGPTRLIYNSVYHTMFRHLTEVLCGLRGVDWADRDGDFVPDDDGCPGGLFDDGSGAPMTLTAIDHRAGSPTFAHPVSLSVERDALSGHLVFAGENLELIPGDAYLVDFDAPHSGTQACQPHF